MQNQDYPKLRNCPFCGGIPETKVRVTQRDDDEDHITFTVNCPVSRTYKSKTSYRVENGYNAGNKGVCSVRAFEDVVETMDEVKEIWNRRVNDAE